MNPARELQLFQRGCLISSTLLVGLGCLAYFVGKSFLWPAGGIVLIWGIISTWKNRRDKRRLDSAFSKAFDGFDGAFPKLKETNSYGYPFFSVCFSNKEDMKIAFEGGHLNRFRSSVHELYGFDGFDIEKGFDEIYVGWETDYMGSWDAESENSLYKDPMKNSWIAEKMRLRELHYDTLHKPLIQRRVMSKFEFGLPTPPWMA